MREKKQLGVLGSFLLVLVIIACVVFLQQKEKQRTAPTPSATTVQQRETESTTEEQMTEAPKDTSDWEMEKPLEDGEPTERQTPGVQ